MLLERASGLVAEIELFEKLKGSAKEAQALEARAAQFLPVAARLSKATNAVKRVRNAGISVHFTPKDGEVLGKRAAELVASLRLDPNSLAEPAIDLKYQFVDRLLTLAAAAEAAALAAWQAHVSDNSDPPREEILAALAAVPDYRAIVERIRGIQARILKLSSVVPADPELAVDELERLMGELRAAWSEMTAGGIPQAVIEFLRACSLDGAQLESFTDKVKDWVSERRLMHLFNIKIR
jgi:hypothetical protein